MRQIAPQLDATNILELCESSQLLVSLRDEHGRWLHVSERMRGALEGGGAPAAAGPADFAWLQDMRYFDEDGREIGPDQHPAAEVRRSGVDRTNVVLRMLASSGRELWVQMSYGALPSSSGQYPVIAIGTDITARKHAEADLRRMVVHDSLTGLLNRQGVTEYALAELNRASRGAGPMGLLMLDVDHFKRVNDEYGHHVGDEALAHIAMTITRCIRSYDWAGRWGGEEFLTILPGADLEQSRIVAERIRAAIANEPLDIPLVGSLDLTVTLGVSCASSEGSRNFDELVQEADEALYAAKRDGRNRVQLAA